MVFFQSDSIFPRQNLDHACHITARFRTLWREYVDEYTVRGTESRDFAKILYFESRF